MDEDKEAELDLKHEMGSNAVFYKSGTTDTEKRGQRDKISGTKIKPWSCGAA